MTFVFPSYKETEFEALYKLFLHTMDIQGHETVLRYDRQDAQTIATVVDSVAERMTPAQIKALESIG